MARGILETIGLAGTVALAVPVALVGVDYLLRGRPLGAAFVALAVTMVAVEQYVVRPSDVPVRAAERVAGRVVESPDDEE